jgi:hypothetical protein
MIFSSAVVYCLPIVFSHGPDYIFYRDFPSYVLGVSSQFWSVQPIWKLLSGLLYLRMMYCCIAH